MINMFDQIILEKYFLMVYICIYIQNNFIIQFINCIMKNRMVDTIIYERHHARMSITCDKAHYARMCK